MKTRKSDLNADELFQKKIMNKEKSTVIHIHTHMHANNSTTPNNRVQKRFHYSIKQDFHSLFYRFFISIFHRMKSLFGHIFRALATIHL